MLTSVSSKKRCAEKGAVGVLSVDVFADVQPAIRKSRLADISAQRMRPKGRRINRGLLVCIRITGLPLIGHRMQIKSDNYLKNTEGIL